ncbi:hypothetical protein [uncultured Hyphomicrobium sp.]|uniref:hypothetical protein n=1 Tax=uncultured Hyphomicrobium sp. TaxID=194373 RepID=UPI0025CF9B83|nr:hypothetical protein [uncultured Hyphomicrobium sp.]
MQVATGAVWTSELSRGVSPKPDIRRAETLSAIFALIALAAVTVPIVTEQSTDGAHSDRAAGSAQSSSSSTTSGSELMFAGYGGVPYTYPSDVSVKKPGVHDFTAKDVQWDGKPFVNPIYYGARIVRFGAGARIGTMLDFTHSKTLARLDEDTAFTGTLNGAPAPERARLRDIFRKLEASHGHNMLTLNGLIRLAGLPRVQPYVGLGAGVTLPHSEVQFAKSETRTYEYQVAGAVAQALVGIELRTERVSYFFEYKFTFAPYTMPLSERDGAWLPLDLWSQLKNWFSGTEPPSGRLTTTLASHQGIFGLGIRSAPAAAP